MKYKVINPDAASVCFGEEAYPVKDGHVDLPDDAAWATDLLGSVLEMVDPASVASKEPAGKPAGKSAGKKAAKEEAEE